MRKALILTAFLLALPAMAQTYGRMDFSLQNAQGQAIAGATVTVMNQSGGCGGAATTTATLYPASSGGTPLVQPLLTDGFGHAFAYALSNCYTVVYNSPSTGILTFPDQFVFAPGGAFCSLTGCTLSGPLKIQSSIDLQDGSLWASVLAFGAKCDGSTDDTTAIQAGITWEAAHFGTLSIPSGTCNISSSLTIPLTGKVRFTGQGKLASVITMTANNTPIIVANQANTQNVEIDHMELNFSTQQSTSATQSYGIQWTNAASDSSGFYRWYVHDVQVNNSYIGMGIYTTGSNQETVWGSTFVNDTVTNVSQNCVAFVPNTAIGMPTNVFVQLGCFDTGGGPTPAGPAVFLSAMEATFVGLHVEGWHNEAIWSTGGGYVNVYGCHVEHETMSTSGRFFFMANGPMLLEGCDMSIDGTPTLSNAQIVGEGSGATLTLRNDTAFISPSGTIYWTTGNIANSLNFSNLVDANSGLTSTAGVVPLTAIASWPDIYPVLKQNQSTVQLVQEATNAGTAGYCGELAFNSGTPARVCYVTTGSGNNWHVTRVYADQTNAWHFQDCADVAGTTAGPPVTAPSGCTDNLTISAAGAIIAPGGSIAPVTLTTTASTIISGSSGYYYNQDATAAAAITYTLPTPAAGLQFCVKNSNNGSAANTGTLEILVANTGTQAVIYNGTVSASGFIQSSGAAGDSACVIGISSTKWEAYPSVGVWTLH